MKLWCLSLVFTTVLLVNCEEATRDARWFFDWFRSTTTKLERLIASETSPSSCVVVAPSLPPCKNLKLKISPTATEKITPTAPATLGKAPRELDMMGPFRQAEDSADFKTEGNALSWREYLGLTVSTVTSTVTTNTSVYQDPEIVVTFSVVGCVPTQLPFNLDYCKPNKP